MILNTHSYAEFKAHSRAMLALAPSNGEGTAWPAQYGGQRVLFAEDVRLREGTVIDSVVLARGDFLTGSRCRLNQPLYVSGNCHIGKGCVVDSITAEGEIILGPGSVVRRWAEAGRVLDMRAGSVVEQAAISPTGIQVGIDACAGLLSSPDIYTAGRNSGIGQVPAVADSIEIPPPSSGELPELGWVKGFRIEKLMPLGAETWVYDGSLHFPAPIYLRGKLVVRGAFSCPPGSLLEEDVKTGDTLRVGAGSISRGILTARGDMLLERGCVFEGELRGDRDIRLSSGVRGGASGAIADVTARGRIILEPNVAVRGQLCADGFAGGSEPALEGGLELLLAEG